MPTQTKTSSHRDWYSTVFEKMVYIGKDRQLLTFACWPALAEASINTNDIDNA